MIELIDFSCIRACVIDLLIPTTLRTIIQSLCIYADVYVVHVALRRPSPCIKTSENFVSYWIVLELCMGLWSELWQMFVVKAWRFSRFSFVLLFFLSFNNERSKFRFSNRNNYDVWKTNISIIGKTTTIQTQRYNVHFSICTDRGQFK